MGLEVLFDTRATFLRPIRFSLGFREAFFSQEVNAYVPGSIYSGAALLSNPFDARVTFHQIDRSHPYGSHEPFLTINAREEENYVVLNVEEIKEVRIVASAEWRRPGDRFLSIWSTSIHLDLTKAKEFNANLILDQVSIGREPILSNVSFNPAVDPNLIVDRRNNFALELIRVDIGAVKLPGSNKISQKINLDEMLILELPRGQWFYSVRILEM